MKGIKGGREKWRKIDERIRGEIQRIDENVCERETMERD